MNEEYSKSDSSEAESDIVVDKPLAIGPDDEFVRIAKEFWELIKFKKIPVVQLIQVLVSVALLAVTFGQFMIAHNSIKQADALADAAQRNANSANSFAQSAWAINWGIYQSVQKLQNQTDTAKEATRLEESPWLYVDEIRHENLSDGTIGFHFVLTNSGKTPIFEVHALSSYSDVAPTDAPPSFHWDEAKAKGIGEYPQGAIFSVHLNEGVPISHVEAMQSGGNHAYLGLGIWYKDYWGVKHFKSYCQYFQKNVGWVARKPNHCED